MTALIVFLWIANMLVDTGGQLFFKAAASEHTAGAGGLAHWKRMASRPVARHLLLRARVFRVDGVPFAG